MSLDRSLVDLLVEQASGDVSVLSELLANVACDGKESSNNIYNELIKKNIKMNDKTGIFNVVETMLLPVLPLPPPKSTEIKSSSTDPFKRQEDAWFNGTREAKTGKSVESEDESLKLARALEQEDENAIKDKEEGDYALALSLVEDTVSHKGTKESEECNDDFALAQALEMGLKSDNSQIHRQSSPRYDISSMRKNHPLNEVKEILDAISVSHTSTSTGFLSSSSSSHTIEKFKDSAFIPGEIGCEMPSSEDVIEWTRPERVEVDIGTGVMGNSLSASHWKLFDGEPSSDDVCQGNLGDCWFLSALSVLAEFESGNLIRNLLPFQGPKTSPHGAYVVRLCKGGCWEHVVVDDLFPTTGGHVTSSNWMGTTRTYRQFAFAGTRGGRLWPAIVEKAYAKMCGGYANLCGGGSSEALHVLTGWPSRSIKLQNNYSRSGEDRSASENQGSSQREEDILDDDMLWSTLLSAKDAGNVLCASTNEHVELGLRPSHAYAVTQVCEITTNYTTGSVAKLVCLRNPHGRNEGWLGDWGDSSQLWNQELRQVCQVPKKGSFWICLKDLKTYFNDIVICRVNKNWVEARRSGVMKPSFASSRMPSVGLSAFKLEVYARTEVIIDVAQDFPRFSTCSSSDLSLLVLRVPSSTSLSTCLQSEDLPMNSSIVLSTATSTDPNSSCETWLDVGHYLLIPMTFNNCKSSDSQDVRAFSLSVLTSQPCLFQDPILLNSKAARKCVCLYISDPKKAKTKHFQGAVISTRTDGSSFYSHVAYPSSMNPSYSEGGGRKGGSLWGNLSLIGASMIQQSIQIDLDFEGSNMYPCRSDDTSSSRSCDVIHPGEEQVLAVMYSFGSASSYRYSYKYQTLPYASHNHTPQVAPGSIFNAVPLER